MHIVIAPNSFKHSLSTWEVASVIQAGLEESQLEARYTIFPIADGGEGMLKILVDYWQGVYHQVMVQDPLGRLIQADYGFVPEGQIAIIELAQASGIKHLSSSERDPIRASTFGTGQLIMAALEAGAREIIIGVGNSATVDGGTGLLQALGIKFYNGKNEMVAPGAAILANLTRIDKTGADPRLALCKITVVCDVDNPLLGLLGAARVFGPQKGATPEMVAKLEVYLNHLAEVTKKELGKDMAGLKHGGAAGGTAAGLAVFLNAELVAGTEYILEKTGFPEILNTTDLLITAEAGLDEQTLAGKGPYGVAKMAKRRQIPVIALAGQFPADLDLQRFTCFDAVFPIGTGPVLLEEAIARTAVNLQRTACQIGKLLQLSR